VVMCSHATALALLPHRFPAACRCLSQYPVGQRKLAEHEAHQEAEREHFAVTLLTPGQEEIPLWSRQQLLHAPAR